jgi:hypothetical protein
MDTLCSLLFWRHAFLVANSARKGGIPLPMKLKRQLLGTLLGAALICGPACSWAELSQDSGSKQDMKNAGHETKDAAKDTGRGIKKGSKKAYHSTKNGTKKAWRKTKNTTKGAVNGGKEGAKQPQ